MGSLDDPHAVITAENSVGRDPMSQVYLGNNSMMYNGGGLDSKKDGQSTASPYDFADH